MDIRLGRRPPGTRPRGPALAVALTAVSMLTACTGASSHTSSALTSPSLTSPQPRTSNISQPPPGGPAWLLTRSALAQLLTDPVVRDELRSSRIYEILQPGQHVLAGVTAEPVVTFASAAALENAISRGQLSAGTYGVLYDPEAWSFTPVTEQRDPVRAAARGALRGVQRPAH